MATARQPKERHMSPLALSVTKQLPCQRKGSRCHLGLERGRCRIDDRGLRYAVAPTRPPFTSSNRRWLHPPQLHLRDTIMTCCPTWISLTKNSAYQSSHPFIGDFRSSVPSTRLGKEFLVVDSQETTHASWSASSLIVGHEVHLEVDRARCMLEFLRSPTFAFQPFGTTISRG